MAERIKSKGIILCLLLRNKLPKTFFFKIQSNEVPVIPIARRNIRSRDGDGALNWHLTGQVNPLKIKLGISLKFRSLLTGLV
jgi:hypothetical protein